MDEQHYVYILRCRDQSLYTGYTNNLEHRLQMHETGKGAAGHVQTSPEFGLLFL